MVNFCSQNKFQGCRQNQNRIAVATGQRCNPIKGSSCIFEVRRSHQSLLTEVDWAESSAGRYRDPVLILCLIVDEHSKLNQYKIRVLASGRATAGDFGCQLGSRCVDKIRTGSR